MYKFEVIHNNYKPFLLQIKKYFLTQKSSIHKARNELKIITFNNEDFVVKSFAKLNFFRRIWYSFFRPSKAKKSYEYALAIGEFTPEAIGYIEFYTHNLLDESYFVARKFDYDFTIREPLLDLNFPQREKIFQSFAKFTFDLHQNNIFHQDYSPGNILIKQEKEDFIFKIVDINRMEFMPLSQEQRLQNFDKLWAKDEDLKIIIKEYAKLAGYKEGEAITKALHYSHKLKKRKNFKKRLKGKPVND